MRIAEKDRTGEQKGENQTKKGLIGRNVIITQYYYYMIGTEQLAIGFGSFS